MRRHRILLFLTLAVLAGAVTADASRPRGADATPFDRNWLAYSQLLDRFVENGLVDYQALRQDRGPLDSLVAIIGSASLNGWSEDDKLAFYINAYNIITLRSIIDEYPVRSIRDIDGVWDGTAWPVAGQRMTLDFLEHELIRVRFDEARIHFALVCAAISCPPLQRWAYVGDSLDSQLEHVSAAFLNNTERNRLDPQRGRAELSRLFDWFRDDFVSRYFVEGQFPHLDEADAAVMSFVTSFREPTETAQLRAIRWKIDYLDYDWRLNKQ